MNSDGIRARFPGEPAILDDDEVEQAIFEVRAGRDLRAEPILLRVRERDNERRRPES